MDDAKVDQLRFIHRELARFLGEQREVILSQAIVIGALRKTLENDPVLSGKYAVHYQALKAAEHDQPNPQAGLVSGFLRLLADW
jgi:hypothetical protein